MRKHILMSLCAGSLLLGACAGKGEQKMSVSQEPDTLLMLVGSYASADQEGIKTYRFNQETGEAVLASTLSGIENPSFLVPTEMVRMCMPWERRKKGLRLMRWHWIR